MKVAVIGAGKTGSNVAELLGDSAVIYNSDNKPTVSELKKSDIAIVFVPGEAASEISDILLEASIPAIWGTTGYKWPENLPGLVKEKQVRWVIGSNFSLGMNLARKCIEVFAKGADLLNSPEFHIHEVHHIHKKDAPSGTALSWKEWLQHDASISSAREGDVKGIHTLHVKTPSESIFLKHEAHDRAVFAEGAIWAARYILNSNGIMPGVYSFSSIVDQAYKELL